MRKPDFRFLSHLEEKGLIPETIKSASSEAPSEGAARIDGFAFGNPVEAFQSVATILGAGDEPSEDMLKVASAFGLDEAIAAVRSHVDEAATEAVVKTASVEAAPAHFAHVHEGLPVYPCATEFEVNESGRGLLADLVDGRIKSAAAANASRVLVQRCQTLGVEPRQALPQRIVSLAIEEPIFDTFKAATAVQKRAELGAPQEVVDICVEMVKVASAGSLEDRQVLVDALDDLDEHLGLKYKDIDTPFEACTGYDKSAAVQRYMRENVMIADAPIPLAVLTEPRIAGLADLMTKSASAAFAEILHMVHENNDARSISEHIVNKVDPTDQKRIAEILIARA